MSPALAKALRAQIESMSLEASVKNWTTEQRQLVFPTAVAGGPLKYTYFVAKVWKPTLSKARLPYRRFHATRHSFATWLLSDGADIQVRAGAARARLNQHDIRHLRALTG